MPDATHKMLAHAIRAVRWLLILASLPVALIAQASTASIGPRPVAPAPKIDITSGSTASRSVRGDRLPDVSAKPTKAPASAEQNLQSNAVGVTPPIKTKKTREEVSKSAIPGSEQPPVKVKRRLPPVRQP